MRYRRIISIVFAVIFIGGGIVHFVLGRLQPYSYAAFGTTALIGWLRSLWASFVMPNIGWLTIVVGVYEIACGVASGRSDFAGVDFRGEPQKTLRGLVD